MIANITKASDFTKSVEHLLDPAKEHRMLPEAKKCWGNSIADIASELKEVAKFRPKTRFPVRHFSIGFAPQDGQICDDLKSEIIVRILDEMGYADCQYFAVVHDRSATNREHVHVLANAITVTGKRVSDFKDYYLMELCLRKIERDYGLTQVQSSWGKNRRIKTTPVPQELQDKIDRALTKSTSLKEWIDELEASKINLRFRVTPQGYTKGISYIYQGELNKGSDIDRGWKLLSSKFPQTAENQKLMRLATLKAQSLPVELKQEDHELLSKTADFAMQKLDGRDRLSSKNVIITLTENILKVQRLRPNKIVLSAKKDPHGKWQSIGIPNIDPKKDLSILTNIPAMEHPISPLYKQ